MTHDQKVALARIISDLIKADNIIEEEEMCMLACLQDKYNIGVAHKVAAQMKSFTWAVNILKDSLSNREKKEVYSEMCRLSKSDGSCVPREAMLLLAIKYSFDEKTKDFIRTFSCDLKSSNLTDLYMVYAESEYDNDTNEEIKESFDDICNMLNMCGLDFVYIPSLKEEFRRMNESYVRMVITYMAPHLLQTEGGIDNTSKIQSLYDELLNIDTQKFCRNLLYKKIGIKEMSDVPPSLLINIGTSLEPYCGPETKVYTEFLCIELCDNVKKEINRFTKDYKTTLSSRALPKSGNGLGLNFKYFGFYKALFDLIVFGKEQIKESRIIIDYDEHCIRFEGEDIPLLDLKPKQLAIYAMILEESICKNVGGLLITPQSTKKKKELNDLFYHFYEDAFNNFTKEELDYSKGLNVSISNIKNEIKSSHPSLTNIEMYLPEKSEDKSCYKVRIDSDLVFIKRNGHITQIMSAEFN